MRFLVVVFVVADAVGKSRGWWIAIIARYHKTRLDVSLNLDDALKLESCSFLDKAMRDFVLHVLFN
jgi:hypothetical protein